MTLRLQNLMLAMLLALTTLFVGFGTLSQKPTSGGYQLFERAASGISADIQLASLGNFAPPPKTASESSTAPNRTQLINDLQAGGTKITPESIVDIQRLPDGRTVWLETGNNSAGLQHINRHADEFAQKGIPQDQIPDAVFSALQQNKIVGYQGSGTGRPIYEYSFNGQTHRAAITVGDNGFIVGANPTSLP